MYNLSGRSFTALVHFVGCTRPTYLKPLQKDSINSLPRIALEILNIIFRLSSLDEIQADPEMFNNLVINLHVENVFFTFFSRRN